MQIFEREILANRIFILCWRDEYRHGCLHTKTIISHPTKGIALLKFIVPLCVRPAGRERIFGVDTHPKCILGRGVPKVQQKLHILAKNEGTREHPIPTGS